jgi:apolipoprotein N-acyltransferase
MSAKSRSHLPTGRKAGSKSSVWRGLFLAALSGLLLALSFPKFDLEFLSWLSFIPLFFALENISKRRAFFLSYISGIIFWSITVCWLVHVTLLGTIVLILYLALYSGVFGALISTLELKTRVGNVFFVPALWVLLEYLRGHLLTGFPWALTGYSQYQNLAAIQIADVFGAGGVSFIVVLANRVLYSLTRHKSHVTSHTSEKIPVVFACVLIISVFVYGFIKLHLTPNSENQRPVRISVIQGNIPQELKWYPNAREAIIEKYILLSKKAIREKPDLVVWPEAALPVILQEEPKYFRMVQALAKESKTPFILGSVTERGDFYYNSAILVSGEGEPVGQYDKIHLVPFGEYIPFRDMFPFLQTIVPIGDVSRGKDYSLFELYPSGGPGHAIRSKFGVLICFEDVFPGLSRRFVREGAQYLINITNDAWYKRTFAAYQHFQASVFRAVENRVVVLRSTNTGVSGFISPEGKVISLVSDPAGNQIFVEGFKTQDIRAKKGAGTLYTRFGDMPMILVCSAIIFLSLVRRKEQGDNV